MLAWPQKSLVLHKVVSGLRIFLAWQRDFTLWRWATVSVLNLDTDEEQTYRIVGDDEADFKQNLISVNSPIARGLIGKEQDDVVTIRTPGGEVEYEITKVEYL